MENPNYRCMMTGGMIFEVTPHMVGYRHGWRFIIWIGAHCLTWYLFKDDVDPVFFIKYDMFFTSLKHFLTNLVVSPEFCAENGPGRGTHPKNTGPVRIFPTKTRRAAKGSQGQPTPPGCHVTCAEKKAYVDDQSIIPLDLTRKIPPY